MRLSLWRRGTGFSTPVFNSKAPSYGKIKLGIFSFYFNNKKKKTRIKKGGANYQEVIKTTHKQAYEPWSKESDEKLATLFRQGKTIRELSEIFGRTRGAIRSRIDKLMLE